MQTVQTADNRIDGADDRVERCSCNADQRTEHAGEDSFDTLPRLPPVRGENTLDKGDKAAEHITDAAADRR